MHVLRQTKNNKIERGLYYEILLIPANHEQTKDSAGAGLRWDYHR